MQRVKRLFGFLDSIDEVGVLGWACDPDQLDPIMLSLFIDGKMVDQTRSELIRQDVYKSSFARLNVGFQFKVPSEYCDGLEHEFTIASDDGECITLFSKDDEPASSWRKILSSEMLLGCIDRWDTETISGWAVVVDRRTGQKRPAQEIIACIDGVVMARSKPSIYRPDVAEANECPADCGFELLLSGETQSSRGVINLFVQPSGEELPGSPVYINRFHTASREDMGFSTPLEPRKAHEDDVARFISASIKLTRFRVEDVFDLDANIGDLRKASLRPRVRSSSSYTDDVETLIAEHLDFAYYRSVYQDVSNSQIDPVIHYVHTGWREGRNPTDWFETRYYLDSNPDVLSSGVNPFWHFLAQGKAEGRRTKRLKSHRRDAIDNCQAPQDRTQHYVRPQSISLLFPGVLANQIHAKRLETDGLILSVSHDCYVRSTGGIQIFLSDEQAAFSKMNMTYVNISPLFPALTLADGRREDCLLQVVLDGEFIGATSYDELVQALSSESMRDHIEKTTIFIVHSFLGHHVDGLIYLNQSIHPVRSYFWLHDYASLCLGFNLLRNNVEFCNSPAPSSVTCRVCVYGESRAEHLRNVENLFNSINFHVASPSRRALDVWQGGTALRHSSATLQPHCDIEPRSVRVRLADSLEKGAMGNAVNIAFIGYPESHKGWPLFRELASRLSAVGAYRMFHICSSDEAPSLYGVTPVVTRTSPGNRSAMVDTLIENSIDLVLVLSPWPETFSYVTYEAIAAGADVVALDSSGNVADAILRLGRGIVVDDEDALFAFFEEFFAVNYVRRCQAEGTPVGRLTSIGTTAAIERRHILPMIDGMVE